MKSLVSIAMVVCFWNTLLYPQAQSRTEEIEAARRRKMMQLSPEQESPLVVRMNDLVERGLLDGLESGKGGNGWQVVLGGMRTGQGMSAGMGYRRTDLWHDRLALRTTARAAVYSAYMFDVQADFPRLEEKRTFLDLYAKYENSPQMDYFGQGPGSEQANRTSYRLEDFSFDFRGGYEIARNLSLGATAGWLGVRIGPGSRSGIPSTDEVFTPETAPGLGEDLDFLRWGGFVEYDTRDYPRGPKSGGYYGARLLSYGDRAAGQFSFRRLELEAQHYLPYFNRKRVVALRLATNLTFQDPHQSIPFYLQPTMGGPDDLRGFGRYRFYDKHSLIATAEHRWHAFSGMDVALFVDAGKVAPLRSQIDFRNLEWSGGVGFRFRVQNAVVMRLDVAAGREDFRWMWTFGDIF